MKQYELGFYTRAEIAEILSIRLKGNNNFKRDVESKLSNSKYDFRYIDGQGVKILSKPEKPEDRLCEILYRGYKIDVQTNPLLFACFISAFMDIKDFESSPWGEREKIYRKHYGYYVSDRTMRNWCSKLIERGIIVKTGATTAWRTYFEGGRKIREPIEEIDRVEMENYFEHRSDIFKDHYIKYLENGTPTKKARNAAWKDTYKDLWAEFGCCFYYCKGFVLSSFSYNDVDVWDIYELSRELVPTALPLKEAKPPALTNQEEFVF